MGESLALQYVKTSGDKNFFKNVNPCSMSRKNHLFTAY